MRRGGGGVIDISGRQAVTGGEGGVGGQLRFIECFCINIYEVYIYF